MPDPKQRSPQLHLVALFTVLASGNCLFAQNSSLSLGSGLGVRGGSVSLNLSLTVSGSAPSALQWKLSYATSNVSSISIAAGPALTAKAKGVNCRSTSGSIICLASGTNANTIGSGVVAVVTVNLTPTSGSSVPITISNLLGSSPAGTGMFVSGTGGVVTVTTSTLPTVSLLQCSPASLLSAAISTCTVTLSTVAPSGGSAVAISSNNSGLTVPASVTVAAGAATKTFSATAATITSDQTATVTASYNSSSKSASISLL